MLETLHEMFLTNEKSDNYEINEAYLDIVFPDFFNLLYQTVSHFTATVNEYAYLCIFLYPHYMEAVYKEANSQTV